MDLLIDLDGTLTDPKSGIVSSFQYALGALGLAVPSADTLTWVIGPPLRASFPKLGVAPDDVERALSLYRLNYTGNAKGNEARQGIRLGTEQVAAETTGLPAMFSATVYPDTLATLEHLVAVGHRLIVCTSKPHVYARPILEHFQLARVFSAIHGSELDGRRDDKAELIAHIIEIEEVKADNAIMIGDRMFDINGAKANGLRSIGVLWGYGSESELAHAGADVLCAAPRDLPDQIDTVKTVRV
jgi:phosphoglycolate phosphatase